MDIAPASQPSGQFMPEAAQHGLKRFPATPRHDDRYKRYKQQTPNPKAISLAIPLLDNSKLGWFLPFMLDAVQHGLNRFPAIPSHDDRFNRYEIFGSTYELTAIYKHPIEAKDPDRSIISALNSKINEQVAIKQIAYALHDEIEAKSALREIKVMRHMDHENVLTIRDIIPPPSLETFEDVYIAYELMDTDLHKIIISDQALSEEHFQYILYQILRGLKYIHSANVLHFNLNPSNLLLNANCELKIHGFGVARTAYEILFMSQSNFSRSYEAPELLLGSSHYTEAVDVWSVGCIFMEMMDRKPLFPGKNIGHQLGLLMEMLGTPTEADLGFLTDCAINYIPHRRHRVRQSFTMKFPNVNHEAIDLVEKMLTFDPKQRITVEDALAHPYLASMRDICAEPVCEKPFSFELEQHASTIEEMKVLLYREALAFNPEYE